MATAMTGLGYNLYKGAKGVQPVILDANKLGDILDATEPVPSVAVKDYLVVNGDGYKGKVGAEIDQSEGTVEILFEETAYDTLRTALVSKTVLSLLSVYPGNIPASLWYDALITKVERSKPTDNVQTLKITYTPVCASHEYVAPV